MILDEYEIDPYSDKLSVEAEVLSDGRSDTLLRVANSVEVYYFGLTEEESEIMESNGYADVEDPDWI